MCVYIYKMTHPYNCSILIVHVQRLKNLSNFREFCEYLSVRKNNSRVTN